MIITEDIKVGSGVYHFMAITGAIVATDQRSDTHVSGQTNVSVNDGRGSGSHSISSSVNVVRDVWFKQENGEEHHVRIHRDMPMRPGHLVALIAVGGRCIEGNADTELVFFNKDANNKTILSGTAIHKRVNILYWLGCFVPIALAIFVAWSMFIGVPVNKFGLFVTIFGGGFLTNRVCNYIRRRRFDAMLKASEAFIQSVRIRMEANK
ncbi:hypothetical protein [Brucella pseudogrignonensis]|uniref:Uncharacterized protein n=1 Tax=Brucella pseudogrignonensis TaxID=419475 RepID=A0ABU1MBV2_9HYPH|nr:hypothetical protein [Brucella pseudogrignonensis]MDR6433529.1 hypothetical protein [Brucella pseudogrignonensis]